MKKKTVDRDPCEGVDWMPCSDRELMLPGVGTVERVEILSMWTAYVAGVPVGRFPSQKAAMAAVEAAGQEDPSRLTGLLRRAILAARSQKTQVEDDHSVILNSIARVCARVSSRSMAGLSVRVSLSTG
jgi:hypothetical protein